MKPARAVQRQPFSVSGLNQMSGPEGSTAFESMLENVVLNVLRFDQRTKSGAKSIHEQPFEISYDMGNGRRGSYFPDFLVERDPPHPNLLCEVKSRYLLNRDIETYRRKFRSGREYASTRGMIFRVYTDALGSSALAHNANFLLPRRYRVPDVTHLRAVVAVISQTAPLTILDLLSQAPDLEARADWSSALYHLIATFRVDVDLRRRLEPRSIVRLPAAADSTEVASRLGPTP